MEVLQTRSDERAQIQVPDLRRTRRSADDLVRRMTPRSGDTTSPPQARPSTPQDEFPTVSALAQGHRQIRADP